MQAPKPAENRTVGLWLSQLSLWSHGETFKRNLKGRSNNHLLVSLEHAIERRFATTLRLWRCGRHTLHAAVLF